MPWFIYIIQCSDDSLYTGITTDINRRLKEHNSKKGAFYTKNKVPVRLVYQETAASRSDALKRERQIKNLTRKQKLELFGREFTPSIRPRVMKKMPKEYKVCNKSVDGLIGRLVKSCSSAGTEKLLQEILTTCVKLGMESADIGDLKLINNCLKELRYSFKIFSPYRDTKKVIIFGSARSSRDTAEYKMAEEFAEKICKKGYMVVTGGGPGVMEAGNKGSGHGKDFALNIRLPFEQKPNPYLDEKERLINFKYFFTRKLIFIKETDATTLFPGGFGTNDEGFEALTLMQTGKSRPRPLVLMEPKGSSYWAGWMRFVNEELVSNGFINKNDLKLFQLAHNADEAVKYIEDFYKVYHSLRYVNGLTVLRLNRPLSNKALKAINREFKDILSEGAITPSSALKEEAEKDDHPDLPRLTMRFNLRDYGRLFELIRTINEGRG